MSVLEESNTIVFEANEPRKREGMIDIAGAKASIFNEEYGQINGDIWGNFEFN